MPSEPRLPRLRLPALRTNFRARLRAQRRWWRARLRTLAGDEREVLFPEIGQGSVALERLAGEPGAPGPRIAILHATAGSGHRSAALALARAFEQQAPHGRVTEIDALVFASRLYARTFTGGYDAMAMRAPRLWGALYWLWEQEPVNRRAGPARLAFDRLSLRRLARVVEREKPDAVVCTHFLPVEALSPRRGEGRLRVPLHCVITDFTAHPLWAFPYVDRYFVAADAVADELMGHGVPSARIEVTGIPVDPRFAVPIGRDAARARFGLPAGAPLVLIMGGGGGVGPLADLADELVTLGPDVQVVVACGRNERLRAQIAASSGARRGRIHPLGFTHEVDALLEACDLVVSKAGGLTCSEALIKGAPLVVFRPTPGQEERNAALLEGAGAAVHADSIESVRATVGRWLDDPAARARVHEAALRLARPNAAGAIAARVLEMLPASVRRSA